ncbi:maleylacetoacetate isomerase [Moraxella nasicaprae]|uniref:Maleylacetoacetate isomerase n=1 Tax=Moraxella nasicaprae TaxID=2904122 RepID=A0ABY6F3T0_9GAMM|nr:maleylacetoacetate isomerase [Moraxella nasicaprae]UXZ04750.1 maleylacetoacetate isomerase [Moraxella nasicaprae]
MKLYSYFRSSASYRVRIALNIKNLPYEIVPVHLVKGEQKSDDYKAKNPSGLIPALELENGKVITQSMAILDYLENEYPAIPLLPKDNVNRAIVLSMCNIIACDTHPLNNLRVLKYLTGELNISDEQKQDWYAHWILVNFTALEELLKVHSGQYSFGDEITWADICLIPQVYNANRFKVDLTNFPNILKVVENCQTLEAFIIASPEKQVDFE